MRILHSRDRLKVGFESFLIMKRGIRKIIRNSIYLCLTIGAILLLPASFNTTIASADDWEDRWEDYWDDYEDAREDYFEERHRRDRRNWDDYRRRYDHRRYRNPPRGSYYRGPVYPYGGG